jgi:hypothetical protein
MDTADAMSCSVMTSMAKDEVMKDFRYRMFAAYSPACERFQKISDKEAELALFAGNGLARNICFDPASLQKTGEWENQFNIMRPVPDCFDARTRPR